MPPSTRGRSARAVRRPAPLKPRDPIVSDPPSRPIHVGKASDIHRVHSAPSSHRRSDDVRTIPIKPMTNVRGSIATIHVRCALDKPGTEEPVERLPPRGPTSRGLPRAPDGSRLRKGTVDRHGTRGVRRTARQRQGIERTHIEVGVQAVISNAIGASRPANRRGRCARSSLQRRAFTNDLASATSMARALAGAQRTHDITEGHRRRSRSR